MSCRGTESAGTDSVTTSKFTGTTARARGRREVSTSRAGGSSSSRGGALVRAGRPERRHRDQAGILNATAGTMAEFHTRAGQAFEDPGVGPAEDRREGLRARKGLVAIGEARGGVDRLRAHGTHGTARIAEGSARGQSHPPLAGLSALDRWAFDLLRSDEQVYGPARPVRRSATLMAVGADWTICPSLRRPPRSSIPSVRP